MSDGWVGAAVPKGADTVLISGGAPGADAAFDALAHARGWPAVHFSFPGHGSSPLPEARRVLLADAELLRIDPTVQRTAQALGLSVTPRTHAWRLAARSVLQALVADSMIAVATLGPAGIEGGTAWSVTAFRDRGGGPLWLFDQATERWVRGCDGWTPSDAPEAKGVFAGVGARELTAAGAAAIASL